MEKKYCTAVVLAAGKGSRMGGNTAKQYMEIGGKPLVAYPNSGDVYDPVTRTWRATVGRGRLTASTSAWLDAGVRLIGGCCRTTPADTAELRDAVRSTARPR